MGTPLKLAITTIGDLLLHNKFSRDEVGKAIPDINLVIPNYQRPYKWTGKNVIQLLDDIIEAKNDQKITTNISLVSQNVSLTIIGFGSLFLGFH